MIDIKDKALLDSLVGSRVVRFEYSEANEEEIQLDAVIVEKVSYDEDWVPTYTQYCVYGDNTDDLGIVKYA
jgi:hypothetical protein